MSWCMPWLDIDRSSFLILGRDKVTYTISWITSEMLKDFMHVKPQHEAVLV